MKGQMQSALRVHMDMLSHQYMYHVNTACYINHMNSGTYTYYRSPAPAAGSAAVAGYAVAAAVAAEAAEAAAAGAAAAGDPNR